MDILKLIKNRRTIRRYTNKPIPKRILNKIIEAGIWGPSVVGLQPWKFIAISDCSIINALHQTIEIESRRLDVGGRFVLGSTLQAIKSCKLLIAVYNTQGFVKIAKRFGKTYLVIADLAEKQAIAATIQNMLLAAESLGISSAWLDSPFLYSKSLNKIINEDHELIAFITFGYAAEKGRRSPRKPMSEVVRCIR